MEASRANAALGQTVASLQGGVLLFGIGAAIPVIASWEQTLAASRTPELVSIADNLAVLRSMLAADGFDPAEVGRLLQKLGEQTGSVATTPHGLPLALPLTQLALLLNTGGAALLSQGADR